MVPEPEMVAFWISAFPAFPTSPSFRPLSSAVSRTRKWSYEAAPDFAPPYTGAIRLSLFNVLKASSKAACDDAQQLMPFSTPSHTPRSDDNMQMRLRLRRYFPRFYIAVFGHSASLCRLHSTSILGSLRCLYASSFGHFPSSFAHFRPSISSIFDAILPQIIRLVLPRRLQRLPRPLLPLRLLPPLLSGEKDMAARPSSGGFWASTTP